MWSPAEFSTRKDSQKGDSPWQRCSLKLAPFLADRLSRSLDNPSLEGLGKLNTLHLAAGYSADKTAWRAARSNKLSSIIQRASRHPATKGLATGFRHRLLTIWRTPRQLTTGDPRLWRNRLATVGIASRASGECWNQPLRRLNEMRIFSPGEKGASGSSWLAAHSRRRGDATRSIGQLQKG